MEIAPEAQETEPFGQWLAPNERVLGADEDDTPEEQDTIDALKTFMGTHNDPSWLSADNGKIANELYGLLKKHQYLPVLNPGVSVAYRGLYFHDKNHFMEIMKLYGSKVKNLVLSVDRYTPPTPITVDKLPEVLKTNDFHLITGTIAPFQLQTRPDALVQSWTASKEVAVDFSNRKGEGGMVIRATISKNKFFGKPGEIGKIGGYEEEMETISVGPINTDGAIFVYGSYVEGEIMTNYTKKF